MEHLYEKLKQYSESDYYPYHMPGHKRQLCGNMPKEIMEIDITEIDGFDNLHQSEEILLTLQQKAAMLYGAEESFYLVNGSTCGILSAISAAVPEGGHILMARNCHKSAYHAVYLRNLTVSYLYPALIEEYDIHDAVTPGQIKAALEQEPDIQAVLLVSPTYEGRIADIEEIARIVHEKGIPLIVDEAHGAHLGWSEEVSKNSCRAGADLVIHSVHKTLPAMTQTALLHVNGSIINRKILKRFLHIYQSSSPSYVLMASIDNALQVMEKSGNALLTAFRQRYERMLGKLSACGNFDFISPKKDEQDLGKLVISSKRCGCSGQQVYNILLEKFRLQLEMASGSYCLAMFTVADGEEAYDRMTDALLAIDRMITEGVLEADAVAMPISDLVRENKEKPIQLRTAWDRKGEIIPLQEAIGRNVGEFINLYPPGIPLLVPGEVMTQEQYRIILSYLERKLNVQGVEQRDNTYIIKVLERKRSL